LIKPGSQLPATGEQNSQLAYLGFAFLTGFAGLVGYKKKQD
jgi:LPXTG-motif cell wall anchor domain protein